MRNTEYALSLHREDGNKINATGCPGDLAHAKSIAYSIMRLMPHTAYVDVRPFVKGQSLNEAQILVRISRKGQTVPPEAQP